MVMMSFFLLVMAVVLLLIGSTTLAGKIVYLNGGGNDAYANSLMVEEPDGTEPVDYVPNEIIVKFRENVADAIEMTLVEGASGSELELPDSLDSLNNKYRLRNVKALFKDFKKKRQWIKQLPKKDKALLTRKERHILSRLKRAPENVRVPDLGRIHKIQVELEKGQSLQEAVKAYKGNPYVEYAELNYIVSINLTPNDSLYSQQWALNNINAPQAWDINTGSSEVIVAVVDTGVDYTHRDLDDNMCVNQAELNGIAGVDDDKNGYVDDVYGYDFCTYGGKIRDSDPADDHGHGTHCSGIIAAEGNNGTDIAGVCWKGSIMALKFISASGYGEIADAADAFYYAVENGADVISNSWSDNSHSETLQQAIDYAHSQGVIMIASAGNDNTDYPHYPAYDNHIIAVAATNSNDQKASFSTYGDWIDISAPGVDILSLRASGTSMGSPYDNYTTRDSGTSMACPYVAGVAALIISNYPEVSVQEVVARLLQTTDDISGANPSYEGLLGTGRLNAYKAVRDKFEGAITLNKKFYLCDDVVNIEVLDLDLTGEPNQQVMIATDGGDEETIILVQDANTPWIFADTICTSPNSVVIGDGTLEVSHGQIITATYYDIDNGQGSPATVEVTTTVDCQGPVISNVQVVEITITGVNSNRVKVTFETDEPTTALLHCGLVCGGPYAITKEDITLSTSHTVYLTSLASSTDYYFVIGVVDRAGNETTADNGGSCYSFTTPAIPPAVYVPDDYATIQAAIDVVSNGYRIVVRDGTYTGSGNRDIDFNGKAVILQSENGPENCIIDCQGTETQKHRAFYFHSKEGPDSVVDGFTIAGSTADKGAIYCYARSEVATPSSPTIANCIITNNHGLYAGGIKSIWHCTPSISNCIITGNSSVYDGGGLNCSGAIISNCIISDNSAGHGAGIMCTSWYGEFAMTNCVLTNNVATIRGGGIWIHNRNSGATDAISNCIIRNNIAVQWGSSVAQIYVTSSPNPSVTYCNVQDGWTGEGNIDADPMFVNADGDDYHILTGSPCINAGDPGFLPGFDETDIDGDPRVLLGRVDIGVDEYTGNIKPFADAGPDQSMSSIPPLVTLDGSSSWDPDGDILTYQWWQIEGPAVSLSNAKAVNPTFTTSELGIYVFKLAVSDGICTFPDIDTVGIVIGNNHAPVADAGPVRYAGSEPVVLDGRGSYDPDGYGVLIYQWQQVSGPAAIITDANTAKPTITFTQTSQIQECQFQLLVSDGDLTGGPDTVKVIVVPAFGEYTLDQINPPFDPNKPTILAFGSYVEEYCGGGWRLKVYEPAEWTAKANYITVSSTYNPPYDRYGDMLIAYLSSVAFEYRQPIQTIGYRTGGMPAIDVANYLNLTYADPRYAVNRVTLLEASCRDYATDISTFLASSADDKQCWIDNYFSISGDYYAEALNVYFPTDDLDLLRSWYFDSAFHLFWPNSDMYNNGFTAGGYVSVVGPGKNLQLAQDANNYYFEWYHPDPYCTGFNCPRPYLVFYNETSYPGRIPEPVTLIGPADGDTVDANGAVLTCEQSQNVVGYQLLFGSAPQYMDYIISDTNEPPTEIITLFPFKKTWWTIKVREQHGATIYTDPICLLDPDKIIGDLTGDGRVDFEDLAMLAYKWLQPPDTSFADIAPEPEGDGIVNLLDFAFMALHWLEEHNP